MSICKHVESNIEIIKAWNPDTRIPSSARIVVCLPCPEWECPVRCPAHSRHSANTGWAILHWSGYCSMWHRTERPQVNSVKWQEYRSANHSRNSAKHSPNGQTPASWYSDQVKGKLGPQLTATSPDNFMSQSISCLWYWVCSEAGDFRRHWVLSVTCFFQWLAPFTVSEYLQMNIF